MRRVAMEAKAALSTTAQGCDPVVRTGQAATAAATKGNAGNTKKFLVNVCL